MLQGVVRLQTWITTNQTTSNLVVNTVNITPSLGDIVQEQTFAAVNNVAVAAKRNWTCISKWDCKSI
jgi:hypothetical protein